MTQSPSRLILSIMIITMNHHNIDYHPIINDRYRTHVTQIKTQCNKRRVNDIILYMGVLEYSSTCFQLLEWESTRNMLNVSVIIIEEQ